MGTDGDLGVGATPTRTAPPTCKARAPRSALPARRLATNQVSWPTYATQRTRAAPTPTRHLCVCAAACSIDSPGVPRAQETADGRNVENADWSKVQLDAYTEQLWIKVRPNAFVPIAEETRKSQEQWFPLTAATYVAPITKETDAGKGTTPPAAKVIGKIRVPTPMGISKPVCQPEAREPCTARRPPAAAHRQACVLRRPCPAQHARPAPRPPGL